MDNQSRLQPTTIIGSAPSAPRSYRNEHLLNDLGILLLSLYREKDTQRRTLIADTVTELESAYALIERLERLATQQEKELGL